MRRALIPGLLLAAIVSCDNGTGPDGPANLTVAFATAPATTAAASPPSSAEGAWSAANVTATGTNGTLTITDIWVVVDKFKLEGADDACLPVDDDDEDDDELDDCEEFEAPPALVSIPVDGGALDVITATVPVGTYTKLEWEIEDIDLDDVDEDEDELSDVAGAIETEFGPGVWPAEASMAVMGTFDDGETVTPFITFFDAEIEVELGLVPPLAMTEAGASRELTIVLAPATWFQLSDGTVMDLSQFDDQVAELELDFESGIVEIERDDDDDD